jgi:hypothetical protein
MLTDGDLERIRDSTRADVSEPGAAQAWSDQAKKDLAALLDQVGDQHAAQGGTFAVSLRKALEAKILRQVNDRVELTDETREASLLVSVTPGVGVVVDVRLVIGSWKQ